MGDTSLETLQLEHSESSDVLGNTKESGRFWAGVLLVCLLVFHVGMNVWWLQADNHTIRTDEEGHMLLARTYYETMFVHAYAGPIQRVIAISQIRPGNPAHPPLFHALGAVMIAVFGYSTDTIALTNTVFFVILLLGCYALARCFLNPWQSLYAVFVVSFTPMIFASSRYFMTDFASAATVVWAIVALVRSEGFLRPGWTFFFAVLNGLGILFRTITFAYFLLPALLAVSIGLIRLIAHRKARLPGDTRLGGWVVNMMMVLTVTVGIFGPWYYTNLESFHSYWTNKEIGGRRGPLTSFVPPPEATSFPGTSTSTVLSGTTAAPVKSVAPPTVATVEKSVAYALEKIKHPVVAWIRYPVYLLNNGLFLTLSALALLGMVSLWLRKQFRTTVLLYLYAWVFGSWFFFTVLLRSGTPRYGVPVAPALAFFAAFFVLALPGRWFRQGVAVLLGVVLLAQYGNMTVQSLGNVVLPVKAPVLTAEARHFVDDGLVFYKDHLTLGFSYSHLGAPQTANYKERLMEAMLAHEKTLPVREGKYANYQKLRLRGMPLYEKHYWPGDNPYRLASLSPEDMPERRLRLIHMGLEPEQLLSRLSETDYILYQADAAHPETVKAWEAYFGKRGFIPVTSFEVPAFGWVPRTINGVLARQVTGELVPVTTTTIPDMNLYDLYELSESADFARLTPDLQTLVRSSFKSRLDAIATPFPLNEAVTFMAAEVSKTGEDLFRFRLIFRVDKALNRDWRMLFHGYVAEKNLSRLPPEKQAQGYVDWNFDPQPPTSTWQPGTYVVLTHQITAIPMVYQFKFGLFRESTLFGQTALLKTMDLGAIP